MEKCTFWNALTDNNGHFSIQMSSDTSGNPWKLRTNNNIIFGSAIVSPDQYSITLNPNTSTYTGNNFTVTAWVAKIVGTDRKSTRLNSSHLGISYAVFCL